MRTMWRTDLRDQLRGVLIQLEQFKFKMRNGATDVRSTHLLVGYDPPLGHRGEDGSAGETEG